MPVAAKDQDSYASAPHTCRLKSRLSVGVFVTAPHGIKDIGRLLSALHSQFGPNDRLVILDGTDGKAGLDASTLADAGTVEHVRGAGESAFHMRCLLSVMADRDITVLFEDHAIPGPRFISEVRRLLAADPEVFAVKVLGRNDTSIGPWSWANFLMTFCECLHPAEAMPEAMLSTSAAVRTAALSSAPRTFGAWETRIMPGFNRERRALAYSNDVWIDHVDHCDMKLAVIGNFYNQRAIAALRIAQGHRRGKHTVRAIKDLALRRPSQIARALAGRDEYRYFTANRWKVILICWASALGAIAGTWFGAGASMRKMH
jgi:hypothetical protein